MSADEVLDVMRALYCVDSSGEFQPDPSSVSDWIDDFELDDPRVTLNDYFGCFISVRDWLAVEQTGDFKLLCDLIASVEQRGNP